MTEKQPGRAGAYERITVNLSEKASDALATAMELSQDGKTDAVNKAVLAYSLLLTVSNTPGGEIYIREAAGADLERVRIL